VKGKLRGEKPLKVKQLLKPTHRTFKKKKKKKKKQELENISRDNSTHQVGVFYNIPYFKNILRSGLVCFCFF
jgi:C4-type Zn-finger protein